MPDDGLQNLVQCLQDQSIRHPRNARLTLATIRFRYRYPPYRAGPVRACEQLSLYIQPRRDQMHRSLIDIQTIDADCSPVSPNTLERPSQNLSAQRCMQQRCSCISCRMARAALRC